MKITYNGQPYPLALSKTLLENLEAQAVPVEFHCRDGHCGACRSILLKGQVTYRTFPLAYLKKNEILLCCSYSDKDIVLTSP